MARIEELVVSPAIHRAVFDELLQNRQQFYNEQEALMWRNHKALYDFIIKRAGRYPHRSPTHGAYSMGTTAMYKGLTDVMSEVSMVCPLTKSDIDEYKNLLGNAQKAQWTMDQVQIYASDFLTEFSALSQVSIANAAVYLEGVTDVLIPFCLKLAKDE